MTAYISFAAGLVIGIIIAQFLVDFYKNRKNNKNDL